MGCSCTQNQRRVYATSLKAAKVNHEVEQLAELPARAKDEELDLVTIVEISVKCSGLATLDRYSSIDPVVYFLVEEAGVFEFKDRSEVQQSTTNPAFITTFKVAYSFEKQLRFKLDVYDNKGIHGQPTRNALIGTNVFSIHELVCSPSHLVMKPLLNPLNKKPEIGNIFARSEEILEDNHEIEVAFKISPVKPKSNLILKLSRSAEPEFIPVFQSEILEDSTWKPINITASRICKNEPERKILAEVFEAKKGLKLIGSSVFTLNDLKRKGFECNLTLNSVTLPLTLTVLNYTYLERHTFLEYVNGGCEISLLIAIDFTKSNGDPQLASSLHYINQDRPNEYIQAIREVGEVLQYYDSDKKIPLLGFGAKLPPKFESTSHCFALNKNIFSPEITGVEEVVKCYISALDKVQLHGPTYFSEILHLGVEYASGAKVSQERQQYFILLILTDGIVNDLESTIDELALAADLPISVIIVGVGKEDFSTMKLLDADEAKLFSKKYNKEVDRDVVQFVPFKEFQGKAYALAKEVLFEIPGQMLQFMNRMKIKPKINRHRLKLSNVSNKTFSPSPNNSVGAFDIYINEQKNEFIENIVQHGFARPLVQDIINKGIYSKNPELVMELLEHIKSKPKPRSILKSATSALPRTFTFEQKNKNFCLICQVNSIDVILQDCGCEVVCSKCAQMLNRECPQCHSTIVKWIPKNAPPRNFRQRASVS